MIAAPRSTHRTVIAGGLAWLAMIGVDLLLHAGLLAPLYSWDSPFLLTPLDAFLRIPAGYLAFGMLALAEAWLIGRLDVRTATQAAILGGAAGAVVWGALVLGLWSISTVDPPLLLAWWLGQAAELAIGGYIIGLVMSGARLRSVMWMAVAVVVAGLAVAVVLQSIGYAPAPVKINA